MGSSPELLTALIIHYNNGDALFETIDSVLSQDYSRIELVVSDDCSEHFGTDAVEAYIAERKGDNIERVIVRQNTSNLGTVAHLEVARKETKGDIELLIAADDKWHDDKVFSDFAAVFQEYGAQAEFVTSQIEMRDEELRNVLSEFITPGVRQALIDNDTQTLLHYLVKGSVIPGPGSAFRRSFFEKIGQLSDSYRYVEDWSSQLRWLLMGQRIYYLDRVTLEHRHGGISHCAALDFPPYYIDFRKDMVNAFEVEIEPHRHQLTDETYQRAFEEYSRNRARYCSLKNRLSVLIPPCDRKTMQRMTSSLHRQNNFNYELIIGCYREDFDWLISITNSWYLDSQRVRRIRIVELPRDDSCPVLPRLEAEAKGNYAVALDPEAPPTSEWYLLNEIYSLAENETLADLACINIGSRTNRLNESRPKKRRRALKQIAKNFRLKDLGRLHKILYDFTYLVFAVLAYCICQLFPSGNFEYGELLLTIFIVMEICVLLLRLLALAARKLSVL